MSESPAIGLVDEGTPTGLPSTAALGLLPATSFPLVALGLLRPRATRAQSSPALESTPSRRRQTRPEQPAQKSGHYLVAWE